LVNKLAHSPVLPFELMQKARISAKVFSSAAGTLAPEGRLAPGAKPEVVFTRLDAVTNAFANPVALVLLVPRLAPGVPLFVAMN
jgi:hypothetical protein